MDKIYSFLSAYEEELQLQADFLDKSIIRLEAQVKDVKKSIREAKKEIDSSYKIFSASQSNNEIETEIRTLNMILDDKGKQIDDLKKRKEDINIKLLEISNLNYKKLLDISENSCSCSDLSDKLKKIRKFMDVDIRRAKIMLEQIIDKLGCKEES